MFRFGRHIMLLGRVIDVHLALASQGAAAQQAPSEKQAGDVMLVDIPRACKVTGASDRGIRLV